MYVVETNVGNNKQVLVVAHIIFAILCVTHTQSQNKKRKRNCHWVSLSAFNSKMDKNL